MKNKKLIFFSIITMLSFIIGFSYAYFTTQVIGNDTAGEHYAFAGTLTLTYNGSQYISMPNAKPGDYSSKTFTVRNTGTLPVSGYDINISNLTNQFINDEMVYSLTCSSSDANPCTNKSETPVPYTEQLIHTGSSIAPNTTHTYTLTLRFIETGNDQNYNQEKQLSFKLTINLLEILPNYMVSDYYSGGLLNTFGYFWDYKYNITSITFEDEINIPGGVTSWDVSAAQNGKIMAYIIDDGQDNETYELYIQSNEEIYVNRNGKFMFANFGYLKEINNLSLLNTSKLTNMSNMFSYCSELMSLDLSTFDTSNVIDMSNMFDRCYELMSLDLSSFDTNNVIDMQGMFYGCINLTVLNLSNFDTSNVTNMQGMFYDCSNLTSLDISNHTFSGDLYDYQSMFYHVNRSVIITKDQTAQNFIENSSNWETLTSDIPVSN